MRSAGAFGVVKMKAVILLLALAGCASTQGRDDALADLPLDLAQDNRDASQETDAQGTDAQGTDAQERVDTVECVPQCAGKDCGDDGCGGSCGECALSLTGSKVYSCSDEGLCVSHLAPMQPCTVHAECSTDLCLPANAGSLCLTGCVEECPSEDLQCQLFEDPEKGTVHACAPK